METFIQISIILAHLYIIIGLCFIAFACLAVSYSQKNNTSQSELKRLKANRTAAIYSLLIMASIWPISVIEMIVLHNSTKK